MPAPILGRQRYLGFAKEVSRNIAASAPVKFLPVAEFSPSPEYKYWMDEAQYGDVDKLNKKFLELDSFKTTIKQNLYADQIGELLAAACGSVVSVQDAATGAWEHTMIRLNSTELPTFTLFFTGEGGQNYLAYGCQVTKFSIEPKTAQVTFEIMGLRMQVDGTTRTPAYTQSELILLSRHANFVYADTVALLASATTPRFVQDYKFDWNNNSKPDESFAGGAYYDINAGEREYQHTFSEIVRDSVIKNFQTAQIRKAWRFRLENQAAGFIGTSATHYPRLDIVTAPSLAEIKTPNTNLGDFVKYEYTIDSERNPTAGFPVQLKLRNNVASY